MTALFSVLVPLSTSSTVLEMGGVVRLNGTKLAFSSALAKIANRKMVASNYSAF